MYYLIPVLRRIVTAATAALVIVVASPAAAQQNVVDLRFLEIDSHGDVRYQNFIYDRTSADGRFLFEGLYLRVPPDDYDEVSIGGGYRVLRAADLQVYGLVHVAEATDGAYVQPALLLLDTAGRFTGSLFVQHYAPLSDRGVHQWLVDSAEAQYRPRSIRDRRVGVLFKPAGGDWLTKVGPKVRSRTMARPGFASPGSTRAATPSSCAACSSSKRLGGSCYSRNQIGGRETDSGTANSPLQAGIFMLYLHRLE